MFKQKLILIIVSLLILGCSSRDRHPVIAAFDIGSGTTRVTVAEVDLENKIIHKILYSSSERVDFREDLARHNRFGTVIINKGISVLKTFKKKGAQFHPTEYRAVATEAFRKASNGKEAALAITKKTGIPIEIITSKEEGTLGLITTAAFIKTSESSIIVWDIGAGSMEISARDKNSKIQIYGSKMASIGFRDHITSVIQKKGGYKGTPNPITQEQYILALKKSRESARQSVPLHIKKLISEQSTVVCGIGGVHNYSIAGQVNKRGSFSIEDVRKAIAKNIGLRDNQLKSKYADTQVSNLILVLGYMEELKIDRVKLVNINLSHGILICDPKTCLK